MKDKSKSLYFYQMQQIKLFQKYNYKQNMRKQKELQKLYTLFIENVHVDVENGHVDTGGEGEGGMNWEIGFNINTLPCVKQIASGNLLYSTGNSAQCSVTTQIRGMGPGVGGRSKREGIYVYIQLIHLIVQRKLTQHCEAILLQ